MLNWRPVRGIELEIEQIKQRSMQYEQGKIQHEVRMKQLENEILRVRNDSEQIKKETEQLRRENAREKLLSALIKQHCFPPESSSTPPQQTEPDCGPSLP
jgi:hypothetical protein